MRDPWIPVDPGLVRDSGTRRRRSPIGGRSGAGSSVGAPGRAHFRRTAALLIAVSTLVAGCDSVLDRPPTGPTGSAAASSAPTTTTAVTITPVTPNGLLTGPGVTDESITIGVLTDPQRDRGFTEGLELWQQTVNTTGGLCGRSVSLVAAGSTGVPSDVVEAYDVIGRTVIGLVTLPPPTEAVALNSRIAADQIPTLTPSGTSLQLGPSRPIVVGPTQDILAINALDYLERSGRIDAGATVGVVTDGTAVADNALAGATWWADQRKVELDVRSIETIGTASGESTGDSGAGSADSGSADSGSTLPTVPNSLTDWGAATVVLALTDAPTTDGLVAATPAGLTVVTMIDGYDPAEWSTAGLDAATAGRVLVSTAAPAYGSDYPAAVAVASRAAAAGLTNPGPRLFDGYATGQSWARLLTQACGEDALTRSAVLVAATAVGAAADDSLYGPSDPSAPVLSGLPATRVSAMSAATPAAPSGLTPLSWPEAAADIEDYVP